MNHFTGTYVSNPTKVVPPNSTGKSRSTTRPLTGQSTFTCESAPSANTGISILAYGRLRLQRRRYRKRIRLRIYMRISCRIRDTGIYIIICMIRRRICMRQWMWLGIIRIADCRYLNFIFWRIHGIWTQVNMFYFEFLCINEFQFSSIYFRIFCCI